MSVLSLCVTVSGCSKNDNNTNINTDEISAKSSEIDSIEEIYTYIKLGSSTTVEGNRVATKDNNVIISSAGTYSISGKATDG